MFLEADVLNEDSFSTALLIDRKFSLYKRNDDAGILVLNFANPVNPGGGVRRGANAQEEDLCRKSSLLLSLEREKAEAYYQYNREQNSYLSSDAMILSPKVEIIRDGEGKLLDETKTVAVLTCAAPMITYGKCGLDDIQYEKLLKIRIKAMIHVAFHYYYRRLILGAWGCGAFGNDAKVVAKLFYEVLKELKINDYGLGDLFRSITFAVLDKTEKQYNFNAFRERFEDFYHEENEKERQSMLAKMEKKEINLDKIRGCMLGGAIGDAMGYPVEFKSLSDIKNTYGNNGITEYVLDEDSGKALISDDTQMTLFTANGLLIGETRGCMRGIMGQPSSYVYMAYKDWLATQIQMEGYKPFTWLYDVKELHNRRAPGNTCLNALLSGEPGSTENKMNDSKGCGGVMRVAPLALKYSDIDMLTLDKEGAEIAAITHTHPLGYIPAAILTHIINRIVFHRDKYSSLRDIIVEGMLVANKLFGESGAGHVLELISLTKLIYKAMDLSENDLRDEDNIRELGEGWVAEETLAIAIYCSLKYEHDFSKGIIAAVNHDGDSDSTGAVTGNILGAIVGFDAIDEKWKKNLELYDVIIEIADDLCHGCPVHEYSHIVDERWMRKYCPKNF